MMALKDVVYSYFFTAYKYKNFRRILFKKNAGIHFRTPTLFSRYYISTLIIYIQFFFRITMKIKVIQRIIYVIYYINNTLFK